MKIINPKNRKVSKKVILKTNNCYCYVMTMTSQFFLPGYTPK